MKPPLYTTSLLTAPRHSTVYILGDQKMPGNCPPDPWWSGLYHVRLTSLCTEAVRSPMHSSNPSIATQSSELKQQRHASCLNSEGQIITYPTSLTNRRQRGVGKLINSLLTDTGSYTFSGRRWQDWGEKRRASPRGSSGAALLP